MNETTYDEQDARFIFDERIAICLESRVAPEVALDLAVKSVCLVYPEFAALKKLPAWVKI